MIRENKFHSSKIKIFQQCGSVKSVQVVGEGGKYKILVEGGESYTCTCTLLKPFQSRQG